ncbi:bactericidal permeability-increasing protein-like [Acipenser ruthenus]|uniref:bactericidal permeability-increasing protein-like n=1 Tax=Acipenser ruthenus TaxID=7906 RepID=UPI002741CD99|nr:bactericidal permeability-increasing protein-like [Acipenser ruthenus]XP_058846760.1 bactericidal permeability-increasing protein-like [Acipenser ruthenus]XP_058846761.1 bactericidal permeability-increasing protein-like [Acipenser ruthenus]XP_058846762.1 bactericidal permeability-increasing protein-like [Acipenser ruthenus]
MWLYLITLLAIPHHALGANPGLESVITQKALEYAKQVGASLAQEKLGGLTIPDMTGSISISPFGKVDYSLSGMHVVNFNLPEPVVGFAEEAGIKIGISGMNVAINGNWGDHYQLIRDSGSFDLAVYGLAVSVLVGVGSDSTGHLTVSSANCDASVGDLEVTFHGGTSWLYNLFKKIIQGLVHEQLNNKLCPMISDYIDGLEPLLQKINVSYQYDPYVVFEFPLIHPPAIGASNMEFDCKGEFYSVEHRGEFPFTPEQFQLHDQNRMVSVGLSQSSANSAGFAYHSAGILRIRLTDSMIPKVSPIRLNTTSFESFIPELPKRYPGMLMLVDLFTSQQPLITFQPDNVTAQAFGAAKVYVILPNTTLAPVFVLDICASFSAKLFMSDLKLTGFMTLNNVSLNLASSELGPFQTKSMENVIRAGIHLAVLPEVNAKLKSGIPLPATPEVSLVNPVLKVNQGFVVLATDVSYSP